MKRSLLIPILAAGCLLWGCGSDAPEVVTTNWHTVDSSSGFSVKVPPAWQTYDLSIRSDTAKAQAFVKEKAALKRIFDQIITVENIRFLALDEADTIGMNITRTNNLYHDLTVTQLKEKLVESTRNGYPWVGMPEAGELEVPAGKTVLIEGLLPQPIGEPVHVEQYAVIGKSYLFTVSFICPQSKQSVLKEFARPILNTLTIKQ